jgi:aspartate 1-decarboxylase
VGHAGAAAHLVYSGDNLLLLFPLFSLKRKKKKMTKVKSIQVNLSYKLREEREEKRI